MEKAPKEYIYHFSPETDKRITNILEGQTIGSFMYIIVLLTSIVILYNQILISEEKKPILDSESVSNINILNRIVVFILVLYFLYTSYESILIAEEKGQDTTYLKLQFIASLFATISAIIILYVALQQLPKGKILVPLAGTENPIL